MPDIHEITRPYPGLRPFETWEGEIFFGREEHTNRLLDILKERRFLAVIGPSGSGKSSLVRAGLLPALPLGSLGTGSDWRIAIMRPGNRPIRGLAQGLLTPSTLGAELSGNGGSAGNEHDLALIETELRRGPLGLIDLVQDANTRQSGTEPFNLLLLVDQFEELFTYADAGGRQTDEAEAFVNLLLAPQTRPSTQIYVVLTMRTDFLGNCVRFLDLPDAINRAQYLTPRLSREQIERAIVSPAYLFNGNVEATLITELINTASNDQDQLPLLQHLLSRMWTKATQRQSQTPFIAWNDFRTVGGLTDALSLHADEVLASLSPRNRIEHPLSPSQQAAANLFRAITEQRGEEAGGQAVRRPQSLANIALWSGRKWRDFVPAIEAYSREGINFLHVNRPIDENTIVDISHEALIRQWRRLKHWVIQETRLADEYRRFRDLADDYRNGSGSLLTGAALSRALEWRSGAFLKGPDNEIWRPTLNWADRYRSIETAAAQNEFSDLLKYIDDSHAVVHQAKRRARIVKRALITLTILSVITTIGAIGFAYQARNNQITAEASLLWAPLDFGVPTLSVSNNQANGLQKLEQASDDQKQAFFRQLIEDQAHSEHFINNPEMIMTALTGINRNLRDELLDSLDQAPRQDSDIFRLARFFMLLALEAGATGDDLLSAIMIKDHRDLPARKSAGRRIRTMIAGMAEIDRDQLYGKILATVNEPTAEYDAEPRAEALAAIIQQAPQDRLDELAEPLIAVIGTAAATGRWETLKKSLSSLSDQIAERTEGEQQVSALAEQLLTAINGSAAPGLIELFGKSLEKLAPRLPAPVAAKLAEQLANLIVNNSSGYPFRALGQCLAAVAANIPEQHAAALHWANNLLASMQETLITEQFDALGRGLEALAAKLPTAGAQQLADRLSNTIQDKSQFKSIVLGSEEYDLDRYNIIGEDFRAVIKTMPDTQAELLARRLAAVMKEPLNAGQYRALAQGLEEAAVRMPPDQADILASQLLAIMKNTKDPFQFEALGQGMTSLAKRISEPRVAPMTQWSIGIIVELAKIHSYIKFETLRQGLTELAARTPAAHAASLTDQLIAEIKKSENRMQTVAFDGAAKSAANIPTSEVSARISTVMSLFKDKELNSTQFRVLEKIFEAMAPNLPVAQTPTVAETLIGVLKELAGEAKDAENRIKIKTLGKGLKAVAARIEESQADGLIDRLLAAIHHSKDAEESEVLGKGLAAACSKTSPVKAAVMARKLLDAMLEPIANTQFDALGQGLSAVIKQLPESRRAVAEPLAEIILKTQNSRQLQILGQTLDVVTGPSQPDGNTIVQWFELLKNPMAPRTLLATAIRSRLSDIPMENQGFWALIDWAAHRFPGLDTEAPMLVSAS